MPYPWSARDVLTAVDLDAAIAAKLSLAGGTMTGAIILAADPVDPKGAATRQYTDAGDAAATALANAAQGTANAALPLTGGTLSGAITLSGPPTQTGHATTRAYVDAADTTNANAASAAQATANSALSKSGGTLTGPLILNADPASGTPLGAATKQYVDAVNTIANAALPKAGGTMTGLLVLSGPPSAPLNATTRAYVDTADTTNSTAAAAAQSTANAAVPKAGGTMTGLLVLSADPSANLGAATKQTVDAAQTTANAALPKAGGTMTGALTLFGPPSNLLDATTKTYVDTADTANATAATNAQATATAAVPKAGGTMTGALILNADPAAGTPLGAATKQYVDAVNTVANAALPKAGGTMTGLLVLSGPPSAPANATTKTYVDTGDGTNASAAAAAQTTANAALPKAGGTMTGLLTLFGPPGNPLDAATKTYVDGGDGTNATAAAAAQTTANAALPKAGGTMTGLLTLSGPPSSPNHAATRAYADLMVPLAGGTMTGALTAPVSPSTMTPAGGTAARTLAARTGERLSVKDFGAKGDGSTDDTTAVQAAMNAAAANKAHLFVPAGTYIITAQLNIPTGLYMTGAGSYASPAGWRAPSTFIFHCNGTCLGTTDAFLADVTIEKMGFIGDYLTYTSQIGLNLDDSIRSSFSVVLMTLRDCLFKWFNTGVSIGNKYQTLFVFNVACISNSNIGLQCKTSDCYFYQLTCGNSGEGTHTNNAATAQLYVGDGAPLTGAAGYNIFVGGAFFNAARTVIVANSHANSFFGAAIQNAQNEGIAISDGTNATMNTRLTACTFSGNNGAGGSLNGGALFNPDVNVKSGGRNTHLTDCVFSDTDGGSTRTACGVFINTATDGLIVQGCSFNMDNVVTPGGTNYPVVPAGGLSYSSIRFANCVALTGFRTGTPSVSFTITDSALHTLCS